MGLVKDLIRMIVFGTPYPFSRVLRGRTKVLSVSDTLDLVLNKKVSIARFGDSEYRFIIGLNDGLQKTNDRLKQMLIEVLNNVDPNLKVCIVDHTQFQNKKFEVKTHHIRCYVLMYPKYKQFLNKNYSYGNANVTRFYMDYIAKTHCELMFEKWKKVWNNKDVVIFEGENTRFGLGNDLFENSHSLKRVLCPSKQAFDFFDKIVERAMLFDKNTLLLFALGATATVAVSFLAGKGYWAIDIGNLDVEYEWYKIAAKRKVLINNKQVLEVKGGTNIKKIDDEIYLNQIVDKIGVN